MKVYFLKLHWQILFTKIDEEPHNGAMSAIQHCTEIKGYRAANRYQRKVGEGKNEMLVINNVCNKLVHRIFVCVSRREKYNENYKQSFARIIEIIPLWTWEKASFNRHGLSNVIGFS